MKRFYHCHICVLITELEDNLEDISLGLQND